LYVRSWHDRRPFWGNSRKKYVRAGVNLTSAAAKIGSFSLLNWVREKGCRWNTRACAMAASEGRLDVLKWLRENGCQWDSETTALAARGGHLEIWKWARENGCTWDKRSWEGAAQEGHIEVLEWLAKLSQDRPPEGIGGFAAAGGQLRALQWIKKHGSYHWRTDVCSKAARAGPPRNLAMGFLGKRTLGGVLDLG
jgi:hypothetical protein